jgi:hypothetical protein
VRLQAGDGGLRGSPREVRFSDYSQLLGVRLWFGGGGDQVLGVTFFRDALVAVVNRSIAR